MRLPRLVVLSLLLCSLFAATASSGPLARLYIVPGNAGLATGVQQQYQVYGRDSDDEPVPVIGPVTWEADPAAGTITPTGLFTAGNTPGVFMQGMRVSQILDYLWQVRISLRQGALFTG